MPIEYLKVSSDQIKENKKRAVEELTSFSIPESLKGKTTDTADQRLAKRKKVKALKQNFKRKVIEKQNKDKQDSWLNFNYKAEKQKTGYFLSGKRGDSIFKSSNNVEGKVGVTNSGSGMTKFSTNGKNESLYKRSKHEE